MNEPRRAPGGFPVVGIIGAGQLARMCAAPAAELAITLSVLSDAPDASAALVTPHSPVGEHTDLDAVRAFAAHCDVVTFDHEHVPADVLAALVADGIPLHPRPEALVYAQDKLAMRARLTELGIPCPRWTRAMSHDDVEAFGVAAGWPVVAKTPRGGYDGKGVRIVEGADELDDWIARAQQEGTGLLLEEVVPYTRELAALVARRPSGEERAWVVVESVQADGVCSEVLAPAPGLDPDLEQEIERAALRIAQELDVTGVLAVELFELPGGGYAVNELAMRPHNTGHWSMDGAITGQFEQHLRAVLDLPLGSPEPRAAYTAMANVFGRGNEDLYGAYPEVLAADPEAKVHLYGKGVRPGRKLGHVNVSGTDPDALRERAVRAARTLEGDRS